MLKLLPYPAASHPSGKILFKGRDLLTPPRSRSCGGVRGNEVDHGVPGTHELLNPLHTIDRQIGEMLVLHRGLSGAAARKRILELLHEGAFPIRKAAWAPIRTNCPAASASG